MITYDILYLESELNDLFVLSLNNPVLLNILLPESLHILLVASLVIVSLHKRTQHGGVVKVIVRYSSLKHVELIATHVFEVTTSSHHADRTAVVVPSSCVMLFRRVTRMLTSPSLLIVHELTLEYVVFIFHKAHLNFEVLLQVGDLFLQDLDLRVVS